MALNIKTFRTSLNATLLLVIFVSLFFNPLPALALESTETLPDFAEFSRTVQNGDANDIRGVYVPNVLASPIVQQPAGNANYVSPIDGVITQFSMPSQFGNVGLLAHNDLSGRFFSQLAVGQEVRLVYGNGRIEQFVITEVQQYQAFEPNSPYSNFRDLSNDEILTAEQVFRKVYTGERHVTFQTCIAANGISTWGRLFVVATPKSQYLGLNHYDLH